MSRFIMERNAAGLRSSVMGVTIFNGSSELLAYRPMPNERPWLPRGALFLRIIGLFILSLTGCKPVSSKGKPWQEFSGERALAHVQALVALGPRPPESDAIKKARSYIHKQLEATGWQVIDQPFSARTPRGTVQFVNLIARRPDQPQSEKLYFVGAHYDTKTFDSIRFVGANDGGSSSGALIELGRVLSQHRDLAARIELIFFDGEEAYEAKRVQYYRGGIIWDMIGDRNLTITLPLDSPAKLASGIFAAADALQVRNHFTYYSDTIVDDHAPFNAVGIPTIDLIDFDFPPWHTAADTMDKLSAQSLQIVGAVTLYYLSEIAFI